MWENAILEDADGANFNHNAPVDESMKEASENVSAGEHMLTNVFGLKQVQKISAKIHSSVAESKW